jgi:5-methylcytosine-specific restriction endonuclease McrA
MPQKPSERNYKKEYKRDHASAKDRKDRSERNKARRKMGLKKGDGKEVDHKKPLSKGGSNAKSNLRVTTRKANRSRKRK